MTPDNGSPSEDRSPLGAETRRKLLATILESRHGDLREEMLSRQGKGHIQVSAQGHEALAAFGLLMHENDYVCPYYRDRALVMGRGVTTRELALDYAAKASASSGGRQMPAHFSYPGKNIWSVPTPTASQLLPACGIAWGMQLEGSGGVTLATVGDASTRQGDFFEALSFSKERRLPLVIIVEDNGYGISSPTRHTNPLALNILAAADWHFVDGWDVEAVYRLAEQQMERARRGDGPVFIWVTMERLSSHTNTDDQRVYRPEKELSTAMDRDPLRVYADQLVSAGVLSAEEFQQLDKETRLRVQEEYLKAESAPNPKGSGVEANVFGPEPELSGVLFPHGKYRMGDLINLALGAALKENPRRILFGEDIEDPKGGVFTLTKGLSTAFGNQVFNSPLAESTILGVACGLGSFGWLPVFEMQFIDFIYPGWNQLVTNLSTLRWRSNGGWKCPVVIYAPYGAYLPGGSLWHSQANESAIAHFPGLKVVVPSTPADACGLLWTAMHTDDPTLFLIPKHMLWVETESETAIVPVPIGLGRLVSEGSDVTVVAWGNTVEIALGAVAQLGPEISVELIDLRSIVPWDKHLVCDSVRKTGRLVVVQEDSENCSVGQMVISHVSSNRDSWSRLLAPPELVSKGNVMIGYNPILEYAVLPDAARVADAVRRVMSTGLPGQQAAPRVGGHESMSTLASPVPDGALEAVIKVPIMGNGIRSVRIVSLLKKPGDAVNADEPICEVETDKAVYPVQSSRSGIFRAWVVQIDDTVDVGREIAVVVVSGALEAAPGTASSAAAAEPQTSDVETGVPVEPALTPAITRRLNLSVPANMQLDVPWEPVRRARAASKLTDHPCSPSLIIAWCVVRAMAKHPSFRRLVRKDGQIVEMTDFDLGLAVGLPGDRLAAAAIHGANRLDWVQFRDAYAKSISASREGLRDEVQAPINITSLGNFGIEHATPIVVPPAMGTIFVGKAHQSIVHVKGEFLPSEVATLSLTFDHKVVNGVGAASFLHTLRLEVANFVLP